MEVLKTFFLTFTCLAILSFGACESQTKLAAPQSPQFYVSELIKDWNKKHEETGEVLLFNFEKNRDFLEKVVQAIPKNNAVTIIDPRQCRQIVNRTAAFVVILVENFDEGLMRQKFRSCFDENFWTSSQTNFIVLPIFDFTTSDIQSIYGFFKVTRRLNVAIIGNTKETATTFMTLDVLNNKTMVINETTNCDEFFPDKLRDLKRYEYKVIGFIQKPRLFPKNGKFYGYDIFLLEIVSKAQNASFVIHKLADDARRFAEMMFSGEVDLCINSMGGNFMSKSKFLKSFNTFDVNGFCALIPIPPRPSFAYFMFVPYDVTSWIFMLASLVALAVVWKLFKAQRDSRNLNTAGHMVFLAIAGFLGQAFSFRHTRWFQLLVMQIFIFMVLILGNAYQSLLVSLLTASRNGTRISTVDQMTAGGYNFYSERIFRLMLECHQPNSPLLTNIRIDSKILVSEAVDFKANAANNTALIVRCSKAHDLLYTDSYKFEHGQPSDYFYILPEKFFTMYEYLITSHFSPFTTRFQEFAFRIFESGFKEHWKVLLHKLTDEIDLKQISIMNEEFLLKIGDLKYVFAIWGFGLLIALVAFMFELLCFKYQAYRTRRLAKIFLRLRQERRQNFIN